MEDGVHLVVQDILAEEDLALPRVEAAFHQEVRNIHQRGRAVEATPTGIDLDQLHVAQMEDLFAGTFKRDGARLLLGNAGSHTTWHRELLLLLHYHLLRRKRYNVSTRNLRRAA